MEVKTCLYRRRTASYGSYFRATHLICQAANIVTSIDHIYVHIPFCDGKCSYCAFFSVPYTTGRARRFLGAFEHECDIRLSTTEERQAPRTIYFGGGTPTVLSANELRKLCRIMTNHLSLHRLEEWTVEVNPGTLTGETVSALLEAGVNRVSIGVQSFDDVVLRAAGRRHTSKQAIAAVEMAQRSGLNNISIDLIAALPLSSDTLWRRTLASAVELHPQHVSVYQLGIEPNTTMAKLIAGGRISLPSEDHQQRSLVDANDFLTSMGFSRYEISNYSLPNRACVHNLACWHGKDYLGLGPAASSRIGNERRTNRPDLKAYTLRHNCNTPPPFDRERLSPDADATERLMFAFRTTGGIDPETILRLAPLTPASVWTRWQRTFRELRDEGLLREVCRNWIPTARGMDLADSVAARFIK